MSLIPLPSFWACSFIHLSGIFFFFFFFTTSTTEKKEGNSKVSFLEMLHIKSKPTNVKGWTENIV